MKRNVYTLSSYLDKRASELDELGKLITASHYRDTARKFVGCLKDVDLKKLNCGIVCEYKEKLLAEGLNKNTVNFYLRTMRAAYNRAVALEIIKDSKPFSKVNCSTLKTCKRALSEQQLKAIAALCIDNVRVSFARDLFLLSYMLRGMAPVDLMKLRWSDIHDGHLNYKRSKTSQPISIQICKPIEDMLKKIGNKENLYIFPGYGKNIIGYVNVNLKKIGEMAGIPFPLTMYVARHTWASMAQTKNVPLSVISKGLGHDNMLTTQIYLSGIENCVVDRYNRNLIAIISN